MKPEHERVQNLLKDTVTTMCRNSLRYNRGIKVQGLLGVTLDDEDIFLIHFNEIFQGYGAQEVSIQQADSVSRGEELSPRPETDDSENSAQNEVYFPETVSTPPSVERKSSRRKTQPWRAVGGLSDPVGDVSAKKSRLDFHSTTAYALKQHPHSMVVDDDNNNEEIDGYSLVEDCDTGDVDIMKQSYMCAANDDNRDEDLDTSQASNAEDTQDSETVTPNSSSQANVSGENSNLQFVQGGPFIAGIVQNYAETPAEEVSDDPVDQAFPYTPGDQVSGLVSSGLMHVVGTGAESLNWEQQYQQSLTEGQSIDGVKVKQDWQRCQRPRHNLGSKQQKDALRLHLIMPLARDFLFNIVPLRVIWRVNDSAGLERTWSHIVEERAACDRVVASIPGVGFFISSITGAFSKPHRGRYQNVTVYPAVSYWIVCERHADGSSLDMVHVSKAILSLMANRHLTVKPINIPMALNKAAAHSHQFNIVDLLAPPLFVVMKDHTNNFTVNKVRNSAQVCGQAEAAVARVVNVNVYRYGPLLRDALPKLTSTLPGLKVVNMLGNCPGEHVPNLGAVAS